MIFFKMKNAHIVFSILPIIFAYTQDSIQRIEIASEAIINHQDTLILLAKFDNYNIDSKIVNKLSKNFYNTLESFDGYGIVPYTTLDSVLRKNNLSIDSCADECFVNAGIELGAKYIIQCRIGKTVKNITTYTLNADLIRTEDAKVVSSSIFRIENEFEDFFDGVRIIITEILKKEKSTVLIRNKLKNIYNVNFDRIFLSDTDFQRSIFNNPFPISLLFLENEELVLELFIGQKRNEIDFSDRDKLEIKNYPHFKKIKYNPNSSYKVIIKEDGFIKYASNYEIKFPIGEWPFDKNRIYFAVNSYFEVSQSPNFPDDKKYPIYKYIHRYKKSYCLSLSSNLNPPWKYMGVEFYAFSKHEEWNIPVFEYLHKVDSVFLYAIDSLNSDLWEKKEAAFYALVDSVSKSIPIYRFYHNVDNDYYYSSKKVLDEGWSNIGLEFYAFPDK